MRSEYCPHCGTKLHLQPIGDEGLIPYCDTCKKPIWDSFTTCVIAAVVNEENEVALLRQDYVSQSRFVCVAGVMKPNETAEAAITREVFEEIGQTVERLDYVLSDPIAHKDLLMLGFLARVKKQPLRLSKEVDAAQWVALDSALPLLREGGTAYKLVKAAQERKEKL